MASTNTLSRFVLLLTLYQAATANPGIGKRPTVDYPEVIPGPGLPSLASLNLTSTELYDMPLPDPDDSKFNPSIPALTECLSTLAV